MTLFARRPLHEATLQEMASVANGIALCIERKRSAEALDASEVKYRSVVESVKEVIFQIDSEGKWSFLNRAWTEITGFNLAYISLITRLSSLPYNRARSLSYALDGLRVKRFACNTGTSDAPTLSVIAMASSIDFLNC